MIGTMHRRSTEPDASPHEEPTCPSLSTSRGPKTASAVRPSESASKRREHDGDTALLRHPRDRVPHRENRRGHRSVGDLAGGAGPAAAANQSHPHHPGLSRHRGQYPRRGAGLYHSRRRAGRRPAEGDPGSAQRHQGLRPVPGVEPGERGRSIERPRDPDGRLAGRPGTLSARPGGRGRTWRGSPHRPARRPRSTPHFGPAVMGGQHGRTSVDFELGVPLRVRVHSPISGWKRTDGPALADPDLDPLEAPLRQCSGREPDSRQPERILRFHQAELRHRRKYAVHFLHAGHHPCGHPPPQEEPQAPPK